MNSVVFHSVCLSFFSLVFLSCSSPPFYPEKDQAADFTSYFSSNLTPTQKVSLRLTQEGESAILKGSYVEASNTLAKAIDLDPTNPFAYYFLGEIHYFRKQFSQSLTFLEKAEGLIQGDPLWRSKIYALMGINYESLEAFEKAEELFNRSLEINPENIIAREGLKRIQQSKIGPMVQ